MNEIKNLNITMTLFHKIFMTMKSLGMPNYPMQLNKKSLVNFVVGFGKVKLEEDHNVFSFIGPLNCLMNK
jgi:hypothetical protein